MRALKGLEDFLPYSVVHWHVGESGWTFAEYRYLAGRQFTEADIRLFTTLIRFDAVYIGHFKCNLRRLVDYPNLWSYTREIFQHSKIRPTVNFQHIKQHYYSSHGSVNPNRIVPAGPALDYDAPYDRQRLPGEPIGPT